MSKQTENQNPFEAPSANLETQTSGQLSFVNSFTRFTAWGVFGLMIITLGLYLYYWMFTRVKKLNSNLSMEHKISSLLTHTVIATGLIYTLFAYLPNFVDSSLIQSMLLVTVILMMVYFVAYLMWIFKFRNRLNLLTGAKKGDKLWLGGIMTFFFNVIYFQYKINQIHDNS